MSAGQDPHIFIFSINSSSKRALNEQKHSPSGLCLFPREIDSSDVVAVLLEFCRLLNSKRKACGMVVVFKDLTWFIASCLIYHLQFLERSSTKSSHCGQGVEDFCIACLETLQKTNTLLLEVPVSCQTQHLLTFEK